MRTAARLAPLALIAALIAMAFAPLIADPSALIVDHDRPAIDRFEAPGARAPGNDLTRVRLPRELAAWRQGSGAFPAAWDSFGFAGRPRVGNPQAGLFYPPAWIARWSRLPAAFGWLTVAHLAFGGLGLYLLARALGQPPPAATLAGGAFALAPYLIAHVAEGHDAQVWAACWVPWAGLAAVAWRRGDTRGGLALPPILALALLTGHAQVGHTLIVALAAAGLFAAFLERRRRRPRAALRIVATIVLVSLATLGLAAVELVPDLLAAGQSAPGQRHGLAGASLYHLHIDNLWQILGPRALGGAHDHDGPGNHWETLLACGTTALSMISVALADPPTRRRYWPAWIVVIVALLFAVGRAGGLFPVLYYLVPGLDHARAPARALFLAAPVASLLAGAGLAATLRADGDARGAARRVAITASLFYLSLVLATVCGVAPARRLIADPLFTIAALGSILATAGRAYSRRDRRRPPTPPDRTDPHPAAARPFSPGGGGSCFHPPPPGEGRRSRGEGRDLHKLISAANPRAIALAWAALALVELALLARDALPITPAARVLDPGPVARAVAAKLPPHARIRARDAFFGDLPAALLGIDKANVNDPFALRGPEALARSLYPLFRHRPAGAPASTPEAAALRRAALDRLGVTHLLTDQPDPEMTGPVVARGEHDGHNWALIANPTALPRAYVVPRAAPAPADFDRLLARLVHADPRRTVLLPAPADPLGDRGPRQPFTPAEYEPAGPDALTVRVTTRAPGWLVVADAQAPGWTAAVDGRPARIWYADAGFRAVALPSPGSHTIAFRYRPPGLSAGLAIAIATIVAWSLFAPVALARFLRYDAGPQPDPGPALPEESPPCSPAPSPCSPPESPTSPPCATRRSSPGSSPPTSTSGPARSSPSTTARAGSTA